MPPNALITAASTASKLSRTREKHRLQILLSRRRPNQTRPAGLTQLCSGGKMLFESYYFFGRQYRFLTCFAEVIWNLISASCRRFNEQPSQRNEMTEKEKNKYISCHDSMEIYAILQTFLLAVVEE